MIGGDRKCFEQFNSQGSINGHCEFYPNNNYIRCEAFFYRLCLEDGSVSASLTGQWWYTETSPLASGYLSLIIICRRVYFIICYVLPCLDALIKESSPSLGRCRCNIMRVYCHKDKRFAGGPGMAATHSMCTANSVVFHVDIMQHQPLTWWPERWRTGSCTTLT